MSPEARPRRDAVVMHVRCPDRLPEESYRQVLEELAGLSPVVQALPPTAAQVDLTGALRYHGITPHRLGEVRQIRTISRLGVDVRVGIGPSITVAATAQMPPPGGVLTITPDFMGRLFEGTSPSVRAVAPLGRRRTGPVAPRLVRSPGAGWRPPAGGWPPRAPGDQKRLTIPGMPGGVGSGSRLGALRSSAAGAALQVMSFLGSLPLVR